MASSIVGILKVLLTADTSDFNKNLNTAGKEVSVFGKALAKVFTVTAVAATARQILEYASSIQDLAEQTGMTTTAIQQMSHAAKQTGASLESFTNAAFKLGTNLSGGSQSVQGAVEKLGLSYMQLRTMSPEQQFETIATALGKVESAQDRNKIAVDLFGRSAKAILPAISEGYAELARNASVAGEAQIKAVDDAGDALDRLQDKLLTIGVILGGSFAKAMETNMINFKKDAEFIERHTLARVTQAVEDWGTIFGKAAEAPKVLGAAVKTLPPQLGAATLSIDEQAEAAKKLDEQLADLAEGHKASAKAAEEFAEAEAKRLEALKALGRLEARIAEENERFRAQAIRGIDAEQRAWRDYYNWLGERRMEDDAARLPDVLTSSMNLSSMFEPLRKGFEDTLSPSFWAKAFGGMHKGLSEVLSDIPQTLANAFTGGGDIMGAIKSIISQVGSAVGAGIGFAVGGELGQKIGAAIGSMAGLIVEPFKKLFGIGINDVIKKFNKEIEVSRQALLKQFGSLERIARLGKAVGVDLAGAWHHQGEAGKKAFDEIAAAFSEAVAEMEDDLEGFKDELDDVMDEARDMGYIFDRAGNLTSVSFEKMQEKAEEFGVNLQALGPAFQNARIQDQAGKIVNAFELLAKGGTDAGTILFGLKDEISALVNDSIKFGTTVPENMRPWIAELIRAGLLLDANGDAITDIGQIQFGAAIETQFERISQKIIELISKIDELINTLMRELTPALDEATKDRNVHFGWTMDPLPDFSGAGMGPAGFAAGTMGKLGNWFANFKTGMPAMLHGMEAVVTPNQAVPFALDVLGANAGFAAASQQRGSAPQPVQVHSTIENRMFMDGHEVKKWILEAVTTAIENNERGIRSRQRDALGIV